MSLITAAQLLRMAPRALPHIVQAIDDHADVVLPKYGLATLPRVYGFLSTALEETGGFRSVAEDLQHYSAARIHALWERRFPTVQSALPYANNAAALAEAVYGHRDGNIHPGDGLLYRGRGLIQTTFHDGYALTECLTGLSAVANPDLVASDEHMLECACAVFAHYPDIMRYCDAQNYHAVWALVGSGRANGQIINLDAHETALAHVRAAIPSLGAAAAMVAAPASPAAAAPAPKFTPPTPGTVLGVGSSGDDVRWLQDALGMSVPDGEFGIATRNAVAEFQRGAGLGVDGTVGKDTLQALFALRDHPHG